MDELYHAALKDGKIVCSQTRVMFVGHSGAGKTSLIRTLLGKEFIPDIETTTGIVADADKSKLTIHKTAQWKKVTGKSSLRCID